MQTQTSVKKYLNQHEKSAIYLLSTGTFLEYFDLFLYVHTISILNSIFFPPEFQSELGSALAFCSTYLLRPFGSILFGFIGDRFGRKIVVVITTMLMAIACCVIALLPPYAQIGVLAAYIVTACRMIQGVAASGEMAASEVYLTELIDPPYRAPAVSVLSLACIFGGVCALTVAAFAAKGELVLRACFMFGAIVALIGARARLSLRESAVFADAAKRRLTAEKSPTMQSAIYSKSDLTKTIASFFIIQSTCSASFYFAFTHAGKMLESKFGYTSAAAAQHNLMVGIIQLVAYIGIAMASYRFNPLKIFKLRTYLFLTFLLASPYAFFLMSKPVHLMWIQLAAAILASNTTPATPVLYSHFPTLQRLRTVTITESIAKPLTYMLGPFGMVFLLKHYPYCAFLMVMLPLTLAAAIAIRHMEKMEAKVAAFKDQLNDPAT